MSFSRHKSVIEEGDPALIYITPKQMYRLVVKSGEVYQTRFGALRHDDLIGKRYGTKIQCNKGFVHVLDMTPELWTVTLPHRTQILYGPDISLILLQLCIKSGSTVIEAGTGSGSLSHCIARTIAPQGKLFTFDFHEERAQTAAHEFRDHGLESIINVQRRDVCTEGFNVPAESADAVFLDLPHPWEAIDSAKSTLKDDGRICCFSPCIEQVQRSCQKLRELNFIDIETYECVLRPYEVKKLSLKKFEFNSHRQLSQEEDCDEQVKQELSDSSSGDGGTDDTDETTGENNKRAKLEDGSAKKRDDEECHSIDYTMAFMSNEVAGHTGFLTFATKFNDNL